MINDLHRDDKRKEYLRRSHQQNATRAQYEESISERQLLQADYAQAVARAEQQEHQANALFTLSQSLSVTLEHDDLCQSIVEGLSEALNADTVSLFIIEETGFLRMVAQCNIDITRAKILFGPDEGLVAMAAQQHRVIYAPDTSRHSQYLTTNNDHPRSLLASPIDPQRGPGYVACIVRRRIDAFTNDEIQFTSLISSIAAHALSNAVLFAGISNMAREQTTLYELTRTSNISDSVASFITKSAGSLREALDATGCGIIYIADAKKNGRQKNNVFISGQLSRQSMAQLSAFAQEMQENHNAMVVAIRCDVSPAGSRLVLAPVILRSSCIAVIAWENSIDIITEDDPHVIRYNTSVWDESHRLRTDIPALMLQTEDSAHIHAPLAQNETMFITNVCQQVALGIENVLLRMRDLGALRSISSLPTTRPHMEQLRKAIVLEIAQVFTPAKVALLLRSEIDTAFKPVAASSDDSGTWVKTAAELAQSANNEIIQRRGFALAPLFAQNNIFGWVALRPQDGSPLSGDRLLLLTSMVNAAALLLHNAQLTIQAGESAVDHERRRIAREIHDGVAQNLAHLMLRLELVQRLIDEDAERAKAEAEGARQVLAMSLNDLRHSISALAPTQLVELGFIGAIQALLDDYSTNIPDLQISFASCSEDDIPHELRAPIFRVIQEALANVRKHAMAHSVLITVTHEKNTLQVIVKDDGHGFSPEAELTASGHFGLRGMRDRAAEYGGSLQIESQVGGGSEVRLILPISLAA